MLSASQGVRTARFSAIAVGLAIALSVFGALAQTPKLPDLELAPLPAMEPVDATAPDPEALKQLDSLLDRLTARDERTRELALRAVTEVGPELVPAVRHRVQDTRENIDRKVAPILVDNIRKAARERYQAEVKAAKKAGEAKPEEPSDWLEFALQDADPGDEHWVQLTKLLAMTRILAEVGNTPACRELIQFRSYFGDMLRIYLERQLEDLRDRAVPALIEARKHDAKVVRALSDKLLDRMGRAIPGEAVASNDTQVLADVMRAFGRTRDVDAARVVLTFANNDRREVRDAAREAIAAIGEPAKWQLKDAYLGLTGEKPDRQWSWERITQEIFRIYDQRRLAEVYNFMDEGLQAAQAQNWKDAVAAYDKVLARNPLFPKRHDMVPAYLSLAESIGEDDIDRALSLLRKGQRLMPKDADKKSVQSTIAYLEARQLMNQGAPDRFLLERALELDPSNEKAAAALLELEVPVEKRKESRRRYYYAGGVFMAALIAMIGLIGFRRERSKPSARAMKVAPSPSETASVDTSGPADVNEPPGEPATDDSPETPPEPASPSDTLDRK